MQKLVEKMVDFTHDRDVLALKEQYMQPSFFEIILKARSETIYSAFLRWMLRLNSHKSEDISPVMLLLDVIIMNRLAAGQTLSDMDLNFQADVLSRNINISRVEAEIEKSVGEIAREIQNNKIETDTPENILNQAVNSKDRIDIFLECKYVDRENKSSKFQVIIENKIDSGEGDSREAGGRGEYGKHTQTERYYIGTNRKDIPQFFVFLTPSGTEQEAHDDHFIHVTYQELLDHVIMPLLSSSSLNSRDKRFIEEFKNELMFPNIENIKGRGVIAMSREQSEEITHVWRKHEDLIVKAIVAKVNEAGSASFWKLDDHYFNTFPREEIKERLNAFCALEGKAKNPTIKTLMPLVQEYDLALTEIKAPEGKNESDLLTKFYNENEEFLLALISSIGDSDKTNVECFLDYMRSTSRKSRRKYSIYIGEKLQGKPYLNNWETVFELVKIWVEENKYLFKDLDSDQIVAKLNKEIPRSVNKYYANGKILARLFYLYQDKNGKYYYDGTDMEEREITGWDMYAPGDDPEHRSFTVNGTRVTMVRMWRSSDVENFIKFITKRLGTAFGLNVETFS